MDARSRDRELQPSHGTDLSRGSDQPMFYAAVAFSVGILGGTYLWRPSWWWLLAALVFAGASAYLCRTRIVFSAVLAMASMAALGSLETQLAPASADPLPDITPFTQGNEVLVVAHVIRSGLLQSGNLGSYGGDVGRPERRQVLDVETEKIVANGVETQIAAGIRATVHIRLNPDETLANEPVDAAATAVKLFYGDRVEFPSKLREPRNYGNPGSMDYRAYLLSNGIVAQASIRGDRLKKLPGFAGTRLGYWRARMRQSLVAHMLGLASPKPDASLVRFIQMSREDAGVLAAMIIGEQSLIDRATKTDFQRTGAFHILVVSGMNVAILAFVIFWLAKWMHLGEGAATVMTIVLSLLYSYMTDLGTPVIRAAIMLSLYLGARLIYRDRFSLNSIGTAALLMLLYDPLTLYQPSFQLTFLSVVVLSGLVQPLLERSSQPYRRATKGLELLAYDMKLAPKLAQFRIDLRMVSARVALLLNAGALHKLAGSKPNDWNAKLAAWLVTGTVGGSLALFELVALTSLIQIALALPMTYYFHRMALLGLPTNMIIVPLTGILMPVGIAATLVSYISLWLAKLPTALTALTLHGITGQLNILAG